MKITLSLLLCGMITIPSMAQDSFKNKQLKFERVKEAFDQKWAMLQQELQSAKFTDQFQAYYVAYKAEGTVEVWLRSTGKNTFKLFKTYNFCAHSGTLGPKVIEGDGQTPEGFYHINVFNPMSNFHLSLGLDYPNKVDLARTGKGNKPGSDIYIHGDCVTIGCIPLTNEKIKEIYVLSVEARNNGQTNIPVSIFPFKMTEGNMKKYTAQYPKQAAFWKSLQPGYAYFYKHRSLPTVDQVKGNYLVKKGGR